MITIDKLRTLGDPIIVASFPRSGTHMMIDLIRRQFSVCRARKRFGERLHSVYLNLDQLLPSHSNTMSQRAAFRVCERSQRPIIKTHAFSEFAEWQADFQPWIDWIRERGTFVYMVRNAKEVMCSYHLLAQEIDSKAQCALNHFIETPASYFMPSDQISRKPPQLWSTHVDDWLAQDSSNVFFYRDLIRRTEQSIQRLSEILDEPADWTTPLLPGRPRGIWQGRYERLFTRVPDSTAILTKSGSHKKQMWQKEFTPEIEDSFLAQCGQTVEGIEELHENHLKQYESIELPCEATTENGAPAIVRPSAAKGLRPPLILLGTHRSGTTWLGHAFSLANDIAYWSEPRQVWIYRNWFREDDILTEEDARADVVRYIQQRFERYTVARGKKQFCEKTPSNCLRIRFIKSVFPDAKFILMLRDGRSVLRSTLEIQEKGGARWKRMWERFRESRPKEFPAYLEKFPLLISKFSHHPDQVVWGARPEGWRKWLKEDPNVVFLAKQWAGTINRAMDDLEQLPDSQWMVVQIEQLTPELIEKMVEFSNIDDKKSVFEYMSGSLDPSRNTKWRAEISEEDLELVRPHLETTLNRLGYEW